MTTLLERELSFTFPATWKVDHFDAPGKIWPKHISPVDFVVEREDDILLIEVKDPSNTSAPLKERQKFVQKMQTDELTHQELVPKARTTWSVLHLMKRTNKPLKYVAVIGVDALSVQPVLMQNLGDRLRRRLKQEMAEPWAQLYLESVFVVAALELGEVLQGVSVVRSV